MGPWFSGIRNERGVAFPLALFALLMLTGLLVVLLTMGGMETSVATNLDDVTRARYAAESGIEWGFDQLVLAAALPNGWNNLLATSSGQMATGMPMPGLAAAFGTYSVTVRNDNLPNDNLLTGQAVDPGTATTDTNRVVILTALGTYNGATRQLQQVVSHPDVILPGGVNLPGPVGTNTSFSGNSFTISGNDTNLDDTAGAGIPGVCPPVVWGISVANAATENIVQASLSNQQKNNVTGKPQYGGPGIGDNTIAPDGALTPAAIQNYVDAIRPYADISLQANGTSQLSYQSIGNTCGVSLNDPNCWGTRANPKVVYVKGSVDPAQAYYAMKISGTSTGAGILIIEDGDLSITGNFRWEGLILITGQYVGLFYGGGGNQTIYGGVIVNETASNNSEVEVDARGNAKVMYSCQALQNIKNMRKMFRAANWREL
jgi:Tfp pilus assembly protein PilX